jgi:hypothetical protein
MSIKPESQFIKSIHNHLDHGMYSMKNHNAYVAGVPDVWYSGNKSDLWTEYKYKTVATLTARAVPDLTPQQLRWITQRQQEGRNVWVILGIKPGGVIFRSITDITLGIPAKVFMSRIQTRKELAQEITSFCYKEIHEERTLTDTVRSIVC